MNKIKFLTIITLSSFLLVLSTNSNAQNSKNTKRRVLLTGWVNSKWGDTREETLKKYDYSFEHISIDGSMYIPNYNLLNKKGLLLFDFSKNNKLHTMTWISRNKASLEEETLYFNKLKNTLSQKYGSAKSGEVCAILLPKPVIDTSKISCWPFKNGSISLNITEEKEYINITLKYTNKSNSPKKESDEI